MSCRGISSRWSPDHRITASSINSLEPQGLALYDADSLSGSILMMGCAKMNSTGPYCAAAFSDEDMADDAECDLSSSCCMGEMLE